MSLKSFHIVFIIASIVLSFGFGIWSVRTPGTDQLLGYLAFGSGGLLVAYLPWFLRKKVSG